MPNTHETMIMVAPNGARRTKKDHPGLPTGPAEMAQEALRCAEAGATAIHAHVRDDNDAHCLDADRYRELISSIREVCADRLKIQITTEAVGIFTPEQQIACVKAVKPEAASLAVREIVPDEAHEAQAIEFFKWMKGEGVSPQFILYSAEDVDRFFMLQDKGVIGYVRPFLLFVLGRYAKDQQSDPEDLDPFVTALGNRDADWAVCAFGRREAECAAYASRLGGHVRIGFENNLHMPDGGLAASNADLVAAAAGMIKADGGRLMGRDDAEVLFRSASA